MFRATHSTWRPLVLLRPLRRKLSSQNKDSRETTSMVSNALAWYSRKLDTHPILTKCVSSGLVSAAGDLTCQYLTNHEKWDLIRTGRFSLLGTLWVGPVLHYWYGALFSAFPKQVLLRVGLDQFGFAPIFLTSFLSWLWTLEGEPPATLPTKLKENVPAIVVANWSLWIPAQAVNFYAVPVKYHVLFSNFVALLWNAYLSYSSHELSKSEKEIAAEQQ